MCYWSGSTKLKVGTRNIKTSVAVFLSILISNLLRLENPFFTAIAAIFTMESTRDTPFNAGKIRMLGSIVGASVGIIMAFIQPGNVFLCGLGMMIIIFLCNLFVWDKAIPIAGVIFTAIMLGTNIRNPLQYSISRILNTFLGIGIAVLIDYLVPQKRKETEPE